ncbi:MAG TPA: GNAT family N-acetyltransferase [Methylomirabilota bacterium]|nr:GNAT family N-acetyltransferase [Methylomirabilota bacterium]
MKTEVRDRLEAVGADAWDGLLTGARLRSPFLSWTWQREWVRVFAPTRRLEVHTVVDAQDQLVALLPLYEAEPGLLRIIGGADVSDYLDLIARAGVEEEAWQVLLQARAAARATWQLHAVPEASPTVTALPALAATCGLAAVATEEERCPVLTLPRSWEEYLAALPGKHRHELTRKIRRLEREEPDARVSCESRPADIQSRLGDFLDLHRRSRVGKARFMDTRMEAFFRTALVALAERGQARLWLLDLPPGPIAAFVTLEWDDTVGLYNSGFHPERAALAPGLVLLSHLVRDAISRGKRRFDFLRGEERYKYEFGPASEAVFGVRVAPAEAAPA